jgi:hypothetical protein
MSKKEQDENEARRKRKEYLRTAPVLSDEPLRVRFKVRSDWPTEKVEKVARMLYALKPFNLESATAQTWKSLIRQACDFLDRLRETYEGNAQPPGVREERRAQNAGYERAEARATDCEGLPDPMPWKKALRLATRDQRTARAREKLNKLVIYYPKWFGAENASDVIKRWQAQGAPMAEVMEMQALYDRYWNDILRKENRAKAGKRRRWERRKTDRQAEQDRRKNRLTALTFSECVVSTVRIPKGGVP